MTSRVSALEPLPPALVPGLSDRRAYPSDASAAAGVSLVQTHISYAFLTSTRVYKLRKPARLGFLDFGTRQARIEDCVREVALNRRLAPDVYLGVASIRAGPDGVRVGPAAEKPTDPRLEHCVVMRRLPDGRDALSLLGRGELSAEQIDAIARAVARFHDAHPLGRPAPVSQSDWVRAIVNQVEGNFGPLAVAFRDGRPDALATAARRFLADHPDRFDARRLDGRAVDGHGDLHLAHIWFERADSAPLFIDCVEFNDELRRLDAASDVAFLAMDLQYRDAPALADRFLRRYAAESGDYHLFAVIDYYLSYRAAVRAKVAALAVEEPELSDEQRRAAHRSATRHLDLAIDALPPAGRGGLVAVTGIVGTGKSSAAEVVADVLGGAAVIASDRVRKQLVGATGDDHLSAPFGQGLYRESHTQRVYAALLERADAVAASGRVAVLDATFARPEQRTAAADFARTRRLPLLIVETRCREDTALRRLAARHAAGTDPSDAGPELYRDLARRFMPVSASPSWVHVVVDTERPAWRDELAKRVLTWRSTELDSV